MYFCHFFPNQTIEKTHKQALIFNHSIRLKEVSYFHEIVLKLFIFGGMIRMVNKLKRLRFASGKFVGKEVK